MIDHERRLLFVHIARTGGSSIETALVGDDWWAIDPDTKHLSASQARKIYGEPAWHGYTKFAVVRNPWERIVSMWSTGWWYDEKTKFNGIPPASLKEFILQLGPYPCERHQSLFYHEILDEPMDFILRFENLQADFSLMLNRIGLPGITLPHLVKGNHGYYQEYYDAESSALVAEIYQKDIERFGYRFDQASAPSFATEGARETGISNGRSLAGAGNRAENGRALPVTKAP